MSKLKKATFHILADLRNRQRDKIRVLFDKP